jgi:hypothetical protein
MNTLFGSEQPGERPDACPFCRSKAIGTLAKVITTRTYWRYEACGEIWNARNLRSTPSMTYYHQGRR